MKTTIQSKLSQAYVKPLVMSAILVSLCLAGISTQSAIISDNFDLTGPGRTNWSPLNGTTTMTGSATWVVQEGGVNMYRFKRTSTDSSTAGSLSAYDYFGTARVNFTSAATDIVRVQADMHQKNAVGYDDSWLALQMGDVSVFVRDGGASIQLLSNVSAGKAVGIYTPLSYDPNGFNSYAMEYNGTSKTLSMWANGTLLVSTVLAAADQPGVIGFAGFKLNANEVNANTFDNFQVSVVPEPATLALLAAGVLVLGRRRRN